jgi:hypothetical protein
MSVKYAKTDVADYLQYCPHAVQFCYSISVP